MTLILAEPFDIYNTIANMTGIGGWVFFGSLGGNGASSIGAGRVAGQAFTISQGSSSTGYRRALSSNFSTLIGGAAFKVASTSTGQVVFAFSDAGTSQVEARFDASGRFVVARNGTTLATATSTVTANIWYYVELKVTFSTTVGTYAIRVNGTTVPGIPDATGANTSASGNAFANQSQLAGGETAANAPAITVDDLYVCSTAGAVNNDFLGDVELRTILPNTAGSNSGFTQVGGSGGGNFTSVNENPNDGDTSYVSAQTVGTVDTYNYTDLPANAANIFAVVSNQVARKDDAGARHVTTRYRTAGGSEADFTATDLNLSTSYQLASQIQETNPVTTVAWTASDINGGEFGSRISS